MSKLIDIEYDVLANEMIDRVTMDDGCTALLKYDEAVELMKALIKTELVEVSDIEIHDVEVKGYDDLFAITLFMGLYPSNEYEIQLFVEPLAHDGRYYHYDAGTLVVDPENMPPAAIEANDALEFDIVYTKVPSEIVQDEEKEALTDSLCTIIDQLISMIDYLEDYSELKPIADKLMREFDQLGF